MTSFGISFSKIADLSFAIITSTWSRNINNGIVIISINNDET